MDKQNKEDQVLAQFIQTTFKELKDARRHMEPVWEEITDYAYPRRGNWLYGSGRDPKNGSKIFDGTAIAAHARLSDGLFGWMCSSTIDWLSFRPVDPKQEENKKLMSYLRELELYMYYVFRNSNFYDAMSEDIADGSALGTAVMYVDDDKERGRPVYLPLHLKECYISEDRFGWVDTLYRDFEMTRRQAVEEFGKDAFPPSFFTRDGKLESQESKVRILHAIYPTGMDGQIFSEKMPFSSVYLLQGGSTDTGLTATDSLFWILRKGGIKFQRFLGWRFRRIAGEVYGNSPAMDAIYDIKMLNIEAKTMADMEQLAARPPLLVPESMHGRIKVAPGGFVYHNGEDVKPLLASASLPAGIDAMERKAAIIREHFKTDFFMSVSSLQNSSRERTREEILQMKAESAAVIGSIVGRIISERIEPLVRLTMEIEREAERLPVAPKDLDNVKLQFEVVGPIAVTQRKYIRLQGLNSGLSAMAGMVQIFGPDILMNVDGNWATREVLKANGVPADGLREIRQVQKDQESAARARAEQQEAMMQLERDKIAAKADKAPEPGSPLEQIMKGGV